MSHLFFQIHPMSICSRDMPEQMVYGWVGVMKLEKRIGTHCMNLYEQVIKYKNKYNKNIRYRNSSKIQLKNCRKRQNRFP